MNHEYGPSLVQSHGRWIWRRQRGNAQHGRYFRLPNFKPIGKHMDVLPSRQLWSSNGFGDFSSNQPNFARLNVDLLIDWHLSTGDRTGNLFRSANATRIKTCISETYSNVLRCDFRRVTKRIRKPAVHKDKTTKQSLPGGSVCCAFVGWMHHSRAFPPSYLQTGY